MSDNRTIKSMANGSMKQKILLVVAIIVTLVVIWQVIGLFNDGSSAPAPTPTPPPTAQKTQSSQAPMGQQPAMAPTAPSGPSTTAMPMAAAQQPNNTSLNENFALQNDADLLKKQQQQQTAYIDSVNKLQALRIERDIAETTEAISAAKLAAATADKNMSDLLTKTSSPQMSMSDYAEKLAAAQNQTNNAANEAASTSAAQYVVVSVSMQMNKWSAVLGYQGKLYSVSIGDVLPQDGSIVSNITRNGVTLMREGKKIKISIVNSI